MLALDDVDHGIGNAAGHGKVAGIFARDVKVALVVVLKLQIIDALGVQHTCHLLEGEHEVNL